MTVLDSRFHDKDSRSQVLDSRFHLSGLGIPNGLGKTKVLVNGAEGEKTVSKIDPCGICGKWVMANSVLCVKCGKWIHDTVDVWK